MLTLTLEKYGSIVVAAAAERKARIATLAAFLSPSAGSAITIDPATNAAVGSAIASKMAFRRAMLIRSGFQISQSKYILTLSLKDFAIIANPIKITVLEVHPYWVESTLSTRIGTKN